MAFKSEREPNFQSDTDLLPAIVQDGRTLEVLMLGYMNKEAYEKTVRERMVTFFSRSKNRLWTKGETSGHILIVVDIRPDCDSDAILVTAVPEGPTCHNGTRSCFDTEYNQNFIFELERIIDHRFVNPREGSYTNSLHEKGLGRIAQKVGEEAVETVVAALSQDRDALMGETSDLIYHLLVLLREKGVSLTQIGACLEMRHKGKT